MTLWRVELKRVRISLVRVAEYAHNIMVRLERQLDMRDFKDERRQRGHI